MLAKLVYLLCMATSFGCAILLLRSFCETRSKLVFWSGISFLGLGAGNAILYIDLVILRDVDLSPFRVVPPVLGLGALIAAIIRERL
jgi:hypothetical protein